MPGVKKLYHTIVLLLLVIVNPVSLDTIALAAEHSHTPLSKSEHLSFAEVFASAYDNAPELLSVPSRPDQADQYTQLGESLIVGVPSVQGSVIDDRALSSVGLREIEQYVETVGERRRWRANLYMTVARPFQTGGDASIGLTTYVQPAIGSDSDLRGIAVLTVKAPLTERLALNIGLNYNYESEPAAGRERYTLSYSSGITYTFK